jgi:amino acid transporter
VALYGVFNLSITTAGPAFWLGFPIIFVAQFVIALALAELVSKWPVEGSIYQWSRRLLGLRGGWIGGWVYIWTLVVSLASVATFAASFAARVIGVTPTGWQLAGMTIAFLVVGTGVNMAGSLALRIVVTTSIIAETLGTIDVGVLLLFHQHQHLSVITHGPSGPITGAFLTGPMLLVVAILGYSFVGFESIGSVAEEVHKPHRTVPRALIFSMVFVAVIVCFAGLGLILATPDMGAVLKGAVADPVYNTLTANLGATAAKGFEILFTIAFLASFLAVQTTASRMIWSYGRDQALPASRALTRLTRKHREPAVALIVATALAAVVVLLGLTTPQVYQLLLNFSAAGFFVAYLFPLTGSVFRRVRNQWSPGAFSLGRAGKPLAIVATIVAALEFLNIAWPRSVYPQWYLNWSVWIAVGVLTVVGALIYSLRRSHIRPVHAADIVDDETTSA